MSEVENQVRELLQRMAEEVPTNPAMPPQLKVRAGRSIALRFGASALAVCAVALVVVGAVRSLDPGRPEVPGSSATAPPSRTSAPESSATVRFSERGCIYRGPEAVPAGQITIEVRNKAPEGLYFALLSIDDGYSYEDLERWTTGPDRAEPPAWVTTVDDADIAASYGRHGVTVNVTPGLYGIVCATPKAGPDVDSTPILTPGWFAVTE